MGRVKIDLYKRELPFKNLTLSDINVVKWLILYRDKIDQYFLNKTDRFYDQAGNVKALNQELIALYASLDDLIKRCNFNKKQLRMIRYLECGYGFNELPMFSDASMARKSFNTICKRIVRENNRLWKIYVHKNKLNSELKKCSKCKEKLPKNGDFFGKNSKTKDGLQSVCKKCDRLRKKMH